MEQNTQNQSKVDLEKQLDGLRVRQGRAASNSDWKLYKELNLKLGEVRKALKALH